MWLRVMSDLWGGLDQKPAIQCGRRGRAPWSMGLHISGRPATLKSDQDGVAERCPLRWSSGRTDRRWTAFHAIVHRIVAAIQDRPSVETEKGQLRSGGCSRNKHGKWSISASPACSCLLPPPSDSIHAFSACFVVEPQRPFPSLHWIVRWGATCKRWKLPGKRKKIHASQARRARQVLWSGEIGMAIGHHQFAGLFGGVVGRRSGLTLRMSSFLSILESYSRQAEWLKEEAPMPSKTCRFAHQPASPSGLCKRMPNSGQSQAAAPSRSSWPACPASSMPGAMPPSTTKRPSGP